MKQLGTLDSAFINLENRLTPQHIGSLGIYDPSTAPGGFVRFKEVLSSFEQRLTKQPIFRTRLVEVPGDIDRPYWVEDKNFDVEFHIRHISLPKPGDWRQLCIQAARLHSRSLDMSRPLWEAYVIEGLDNIPGLPPGAFAMYTKMHHSLVDGAGGSAFMSALHDLEPNPPTPLNREADTIVVDREPSDRELLARAVLNRTLGSVKMARSMGGAAVELAKYGLAVAREEVASPDVAAPKTRFNNPVGPHRVAEGTVFSLDDFKAIKNAAGVTINDVALGVIGGALRHYLQLNNELPEESLAAGIPLNMRNRRDLTEENNQVGSTFTELHTNIADPVERLHAIKASTDVAKQAAEGNPMTEALRVAGFFSPLVSKAAASLWAKNQLSRYVPMNISTVVTNVPGPNFPLYCAGAKMVRFHGLGLLTPGCGLFHAIFSSNGVVSVSILADRDAMPDPHIYMECLQKSFKETFEAATGASPAGLPSENVTSKGASSSQAKADESKPRKAKAVKGKTAKGKASKTKATTAKATTTKASTAKSSTPEASKAKPAKAADKPAKKTATKAAAPKAAKPAKKTVAKKAAAPKKLEAKSNGKKSAVAPRKPGSLRRIKIPENAKRTTSSATVKKATASKTAELSSERSAT